MPKLQSPEAKRKLLLWLGGSTLALATAVGMVSKHEGVVLNTYKDPIGIWTACVGETAFVVQPGDIKPGAKFTPEQCTERLYVSMAEHAEPVIRCTAPAALTTGQKIAFMSLAFNIGGPAFCSSTLARKARTGDVAGSCAELSRWNMAGGRVWTGLTTRRADERRICESKTAVGQ